MSGADKSLQLLLELGNPATRRTRAQQVEHAMRVALTLMNADAVVVRAPGNRRGKRLALHGGSTAPAVLPPPPDGSSVVRILTENCVPLLVPNLADDQVLAQSDDCPGITAGPAMFIPLRQRDPAIGYLALYRRCGRAPFSPGDCRQIVLLTAWLSGALEVLRLSSGTERLVVTDDLTDVYNARFIDAALRREVRRAGRYGQELSIILIEVDNLEDFNSEHGELRGSALFTDLASLLTQQTRAFDLLGRHGHNGFMVILPQTDWDGAVVVAKRIRESVKRQELAEAEVGAVTVNIGVATFPSRGADTDEVIAAAERALRQGRKDDTDLESLEARAA